MKAGVIGSINFDIELRVDRFPVIGEAVDGSVVYRGLGGKGANQAVALRRGGVETFIIGKIGNDNLGEACLSLLKKEGVNIDYVIVDSKISTGSATILVDKSGNSEVILFEGANAFLSPSDIEIASFWDQIDYLLVQTEIPFETVEYALKTAKGRGKWTFLTVSKCDIPGDLFRLVDVLFIGPRQLRVITGKEANHIESAKVALSILRKFGAKNIVLIMGLKGAIFYDGTDYKFVQGYSIKPVDQSGARDAFVAAFASNLIKTKDVPSALEIANKAYAISSSRFGTASSFPTLEKLQNFALEKTNEIAEKNILVKELTFRAYKLRRLVLEMLDEAGSGHPGGSLSAAEIMAVLYFYEMVYNPKDPDWENRDRFILSKGHAAPILYAALAEAGFFPEEELRTLRKFGSRLQGHPDMRKTPGVDFTTGSLGQGLSAACGMALAAKIDGRGYRVYVLMGDGELEEGQVWEAAMTARKYALDNLCVIVDFNGLQIDGSIASVMESLEPVAEKWKAFGWHVIEVDGHNVYQLVEALDEAKRTKGIPTCIVAYTIKGKGVSFMEGVIEYHGSVLKPEETQKALKELENIMNQLGG